MRTITPRFVLIPFLLVLVLVLGLVAACGTGSMPTGEPAPTSAPGNTDSNMMDEPMEPEGDSMMDDPMEPEGGDSMMGDPIEPEGDPMMDDPMASREKALVDGWYRGRSVEYYDFGGNSAVNGSAVGTAPIYVFIHGFNTDGSPRLVDGQHNIVNVVPGYEGYSDLWQVMLVTVPEGYEPDSITSKEQLDAAGYQITPTDMLVNCPIVPRGTTLEGGEELVQGWYDGEEVYYPDFGLDSPAAIPIWVFITGMDDQGNPQFVAGQNNIIDAVPGDSGYRAFWRVNLVTVPEGYQPNSIRSAAEVRDSGFPITVTDMVVNCPVTFVAES